MSLFAKHIHAARAEGRVTARMSSEGGGVEDPLNGVTADAPVETEVDEGPKAEGVDAFDAQRDDLNKQHGMIRAHQTTDLVAEGEDEVVLEPELEPVVEETPAEVVDDSVSVDTAAEEAPEVPADEEVPAGDDAPADVDPVTEITVDAEAAPGAEDEVIIAPEPEPVVEEPAVEEPVVAEPVEVDDDTGEVSFTSEEDGAEEDEDEVEADASVDDDLDDTADEIEDLETEMRMLSESRSAIEAYGINPTAMAIMQTTGLLNGTALESLGLEAFGFEAPKSHESQMAMEALGEKIKEKAAQWSAKILSVASSFTSKVMSVLTPLWNKIVGAVKLLTTTAWDVTKAAGKVIKAHPYATIAATVAAVAAVGGILVWSGASLPSFGAKPQALETFANAFKSKIDKIKWPFGKFDVSLVGNKLKPVYTAVVVPVKEGTAKSLGWTQTAVKSIGGQLGRAWTPVKDGANAAGARATKVAAASGKFAADVGKTMFLSGGELAKSFGAMATHATGSQGIGDTAGGIYFFTLFFSFAVTLSMLINKVVLGAFRLIASTFHALSSLVAGPKPVMA